MILKSAILSIAMALSTAVSAPLDSSAACAGPQQASSIERSQWPMGPDRAAIIRSYDYTLPAKTILVVHRVTTWLASAPSHDVASRGRLQSQLTKSLLSTSKSSIVSQSSLGFMSH